MRICRCSGLGIFCVKEKKERKGRNPAADEDKLFQFDFTLRSMMASSGQTSWQQKHLMHFE